ncbi:hypothetical protein MBLNU459_g3962t1 [Dothideomycetes sp. NU459]
MCQKVLKVWECDHTEEEDPRRCQYAQHRRKNCDNYAFAWAMRVPITDRHDGPCPDCIRSREEAERQRANHAFIEASEAHPILRTVSERDDLLRQGTGRQRFDRTRSGSSMMLMPTTAGPRAQPPRPPPEQQPTPSTANESAAIKFRGARFDPHDSAQQQQGQDQPAPGPALPMNTLRAAVQAAVQHAVLEAIRAGRLAPEHAQAAVEAAVSAALLQNRGVSEAVQPHLPSGADEAPNRVNGTGGGGAGAAAHPSGLRSHPLGLDPPGDWRGAVVLDEDEYPHIAFRDEAWEGTVRPAGGTARRVSYAGSVGESGWVPPRGAMAQPIEERDVEPPSRTPSPVTSRRG